jgi:hypothetical protein
MASEFIGVIRSTTTGKVYAVINPDEDQELYNPRWLLIKGETTQPIQIVLVPRAEYMAAGTLDDLARLVERIEQERDKER